MAEKTKLRTCGIAMPIAAMGDAYSDEHWRRVRKIIVRAIERAGMKPQLVWENPEVETIQSAILQNLYENDIVICDVSGLNPNVMLEAGLRLSTKKPTVIITDRLIKPPFDISTIGYIEYQKDLEYNAIEDFISKLEAKLKAIIQAYDAGTYQSFVENFKFETVIPSTVNVAAEDYLREQVERLGSLVHRIERQQRRNVEEDVLESRIRRPVIEMKVEGSQETLDIIEIEIDSDSNFEICNYAKIDESMAIFRIPIKLPARQSNSSLKEYLYGLVNRNGGVVHEYSLMRV